jgi:mono/diheme cytochrome c family protein
MALPEVLKSVIVWLRAGYPEGVPEHDYMPLFALLGSHLTDDDIAAIATELESNSDQATAQKISDALQAAGHGAPLDVDVARVRARLAAGGWPLATP